MNDVTRAAIMLIITNALTVAVEFGIHLSTSQATHIESLVNSVLILAMLLWKHGQQASGTVSNVSVTTEANPTQEQPRH